jgi:hypothetical protein
MRASRRQNGQHEEVVMRSRARSLAAALLAFGAAGAAGAATITITRPAGGEVWYVGTTPRIEWTTVGVGNAVIYCSTSGGAGNWSQVTGSVLDTSPDWGSYPWTIGQEAVGQVTPSANCVVNVRDYFGFPSVNSNVFEVKAVDDGDGDGMADTWESDYFSDTLESAGGDADGDLYTNLEEFMGVTDPTNATDMPGPSRDTPPLIMSSAPVTATQGTQYAYTITASGTPAPTFNVTGLPGWLTFTGADTISGTPGVADLGPTGTITVTATNRSGSVDQQFIIDVTESSGTNSPGFCAPGREEGGHAVLLAVAVIMVAATPRRRRPQTGVGE